MKLKRTRTELRQDCSSIYAVHTISGKESEFVFPAFNKYPVLLCPHSGELPFSYAGDPLGKTSCGPWIIGDKPSRTYCPALLARVHLSLLRGWAWQSSAK